MPFELHIALRYLLARRKQAFISVISLIDARVMVGVMALVIALALMTDYAGPAIAFSDPTRTSTCGTRAARRHQAGQRSCSLPHALAPRRIRRGYFGGTRDPADPDQGRRSGAQQRSPTSAIQGGSSGCAACLDCCRDSTASCSAGPGRQTASRSATPRRCSRLRGRCPHGHDPEVRRLRP
jgi:hypothetical protein